MAGKRAASGSWDLPLSRTCGPFYRFHSRQHGAIYFSKRANHRWDDPLKEFGVLYAAERWDGAFVETVLHRPDQREIVRDDCVNLAVSHIRFKSELLLVDVTDQKTLRKLGVDEELTKGPYSRSQALARQIYECDERIGGILYKSKLAPPECCVALFDFPEDQITVVDLGGLFDASNHGVLATALHRFGVFLIEDGC